MLFIALDVNLNKQVYLGETQQWFPSRKYQHEYAVKNNSKTNGIAQHVMETNHEIDWENRKFLDSESHWRRRKIKKPYLLIVSTLKRKSQLAS